MGGYTISAAEAAKIKKEQEKNARKAYDKWIKERVSRATEEYRANPVPGGYVQYLQPVCPWQLRALSNVVYDMWINQGEQQERLKKENCCSICEFEGFACFYCDHFQRR